MKLRWVEGEDIDPRTLAILSGAVLVAAVGGFAFVDGLAWMVVCGVVALVAVVCLAAGIWAGSALRRHGPNAGLTR